MVMDVMPVRAARIPPNAMERWLALSEKFPQMDDETVVARAPAMMNAMRELVAEPL